MAIKPIPFKTNMVQAILAGRKTVTRRIVKGEALRWLEEGFTPEFVAMKENGLSKYQVGDILWVRETFYSGYLLDENDNIPEDAELAYWYFADCRSNRPGDVSDNWCMHMYGPDKSLWPKWKPSIFMPRAGARIFLEITGVRIERLQDITEADVIREGIESFRPVPGDGPAQTMYKNYLTNKYTEVLPVASFITLWESINGKGSWEENPWVWVYEFKPVEKPENF